MITGDFRSVVHEAAAEPWRIDVVVREILAAPEERGRVMLQYACEALRAVPIGAGDALTLGEMVEWCWGARGVFDEAVPGLAWAVVMGPVESPAGSVGGTVLCDGDDWGTTPYVIELQGFGLFCVGRPTGHRWRPCGNHEGDHAAYYNANRRHAKEAA